MSQGVPITKMSGAGNDFVVLDDTARRAVSGDWTDWVRRVCRRGLSVGADGVLVLTPVSADRVRVEFYNPDGGSAFCGNGSRCAARFAHRRGLVGEAMTLETAAGDVVAEVEGAWVRLVLPAPTDLGTLDLEVASGTIPGRRIDAGSPHFVVQVGDVAGYPLGTIGPQVRRHPLFGERGTNFDIVATDVDGQRLLRTWERGVEAETLACGSGAVATAYALMLDGGERAVRLRTAGRAILEVTIVGPAERPTAASLGGDARLVFEARLVDEAIRF